MESLFIDNSDGIDVERGLWNCVNPISCSITECFKYLGKSTWGTPTFFVSDSLNDCLMELQVFKLIQN